MIRLLRTLVALVGAVILIAFAVGNRQLTSVSLWPTPFVIDVPLYAILLAGLILGVVLGGIATWLGGHRRRVDSNRWRRRAEALEREAAFRRREEEQALRARAAQAPALPVPAR